MNYRHGQSKSRLYNVWTCMKNRCFSANDHQYKNYGGRGITVCDEWRRDFTAFRDWAMANGYDEKAPRGQCTLDRIDVNGNYCPENCRWATVQEQNWNKRNNRLHKGEVEIVLTLKEYTLISLIRNSYNPEKVLETAMDSVKEGPCNVF